MFESKSRTRGQGTGSRVVGIILIFRREFSESDLSLSKKIKIHKNTTSLLITTKCKFLSWLAKGDKIANSGMPQALIGLLTSYRFCVGDPKPSTVHGSSTTHLGREGLCHVWVFHGT